MDPLVQAMLIQLFGSGIAGAFAPDGQELKSFADKGFSPDINPATMLEQLKDMITRMGQSQGERAFGGVSLPSAFAQQPGVYTGGGLPMPIGLTASDPALANPGLLSIPGMNNYDPFQSLGIIGTPWAPGGDASTNTEWPEGIPSGPQTPGDNPDAPPDKLFGATDPNAFVTGDGSGVLTDDLDQALGAIDLLMRGEMGALV